MIDRRATTAIADNPPLGATVGDMEPASAASAPKQSRKEPSGLAGSTAMGSIE